MSSWDDFCKTVSETAQKTTKKAGCFIDETKLRYDLGNETRELDRLFCEVGKLTYAQIRKDADSSVRISELFNSIDSQQEKVSAIKKQISEVRKKRDSE